MHHHYVWRNPGRGMAGRVTRSWSTPTPHPRPVPPGGGAADRLKADEEAPQTPNPVPANPSVWDTIFFGLDTITLVKPLANHAHHLCPNLGPNLALDFDPDRGAALIKTHHR